MGIPTLRTCHFETSEDIMNKFKLQAFISQEFDFEKLVELATLLHSHSLEHKHFTS